MPIIAKSSQKCTKQKVNQQHTLSIITLLGNLTPFIVIGKIAKFNVISKK